LIDKKIVWPDAEGSRIKADDGTAAKWYLIDKLLPYGQVIAEYDNSGSLTCSYVYGQDRISMTRGGVTHTYQADGQGSIRLLTDASGNVTDIWTYSAFGEIVSRTGTTENAFTYTGEQWDPNAGFYYLRARWYSPENGRFISVDPDAGNRNSPISLHRYLYANASSINFSDPTGRFSLVEAVATFVLLSTISCQPLVNFQYDLPPTQEQIKTAPEVIAKFIDAIDKSKMDDPVFGHEEGGWIYAAPKRKKMTVILKPIDDPKKYEIDLNNPPILGGLWVVGTFHTHPHGTYLVDLNQVHNASPQDLHNEGKRGVPGVIISTYQTTTYNTYGPAHRSFYDDGRPGFPGDYAK
jgi:RHS repeat-associated protein